LCCATGSVLDDKAEADLTRLLGFAQPEKVYFCTSQAESENALQRVEDRLRELVGEGCAVSAVGATQLIPLIQRHPEPFRMRYAAELLEHADFLAHSANLHGDLDVLGMQVALATQFDDNAQALRAQLTRQLVLRSLPPGATKTLRALAKSASDSLRLPRIVHSEYFREAIEALVNEGLVDATGELFSITEAGQAALRVGQAATESGLGRGRTAVRAAIETLLGSPLDEGEFNTLWKQLLDEFAALFFSQGLKIIQAIASLTHDEPHPATKKTFAELIDGMRARITRLGVGGARSDAVAQAVIDLFSERDSEALAWLTDVAVKYVNLCSLGLEPTAQQEVSGRLKEISLVLDTDIVLSYLSRGERPHQAIEDTLNRWKEIGGAVIVLPPVVEEAAYHAWISDFEYQEVWRQFADLGPNEMHHYARNAFVRSFYFEAEGRYEPTRWGRYISEYRGRDKNDVSVMAELLDDKGFDVREDVAADDEFTGVVRQRIYALRHIDTSKFIRKQVADKVDRDSRILAHLKAAREDQAKRHGTTVVVSSSPILQKAAESFARKFGEPSPVWPIGALAYLVSLIPGVRLTLNVLRNCLFDEGEFDMMDRVTQFAMRVIRQSKEYSLGYSQRPTLKRALRTQIDKAAVHRGQRPGEFVNEAMDSGPEGREALAEVIAEAVDTIQASRSEKEIDTLRQTIREMGGHNQ
jgi:hypothetical protein